MKVFGSSGPSFLVIWVLCFLALVTSSNCLYGHDIRGNGIFINQDGDVMDEAEPRSHDLITVYEDDDRQNDFDDGDDDDDDDDDGGNFEGDSDENEDDSNERHADPSGRKKALCLDNECVVAAGKMISMMNQSADPCDDFYNYVCGNFKMTYEPFEDMTRSMSFEILRRENRFLIHNVLLKMGKNSGVKAVDKVKAFYDSCMRLEHKGEEDGLKAIIKKYGPWPMDDGKWNPKKWNFNRKLIDISTALPVALLFSASVQLDKKDPEIHVFQVSQAGLGIPSVYYLSKDKQKKKIRDAYLKLMKNVMRMLGYGKKSHIKALHDVYMFEKKLASIFLSKTVLRQDDKTYKKVSVRYLKRICPEIDWDMFFNSQLKLAGLNKQSMKLIGIIGEDYFKHLAKLLRSTKKQTLANYVLWKIVLALNSVGGKKYRDEGFLFSQVYSGQKARAPFWDSCTSAASVVMPFAYGRIYVDTRFKSKFAVKEVKRLVKELKTEFTSNFKNVRWMAEKTKRKARIKANAIKALIAYPDFILSNKKLNKMYAGLKLKEKDYLGNCLKLYVFNRKDGIRLLTKKRDRARWTSGPSIVNAFYSQVYNRIVFPAGILQPLFYHHLYPSAMKYGGIGAVIGHEITHAFDDKGRKYDGDGRLHQWWDAMDIKKFERRADCIRKQYSSYSIYGKHMNGRLSCGENIADNGGIKMAYKAFRKHLAKHPKTKALPGLQHLSDDQLFFVSFAKVWCVIQEKARTLKNIVTDPHSYPKFRVIGTVSNSPDFARAFKCKVGSKMNPAKKCTIW